MQFQNRSSGSFALYSKKKHTKRRESGGNIAFRKMALRNAVLNHLRVTVNDNGPAAFRAFGWGSWSNGSRWMSSEAFLDKNEVTERVLSVVKSFPKVEPSKKAMAGIKRINLEGLRWRVFDCKGQVLGRLASHISVVLQGKDKPTYAPNRDDGDMCIVLNAKDICVTGRKMTDKVYRWHTGYVGHLKERTLKDQMVKDPTEVIRKAVFRMLPKNKLQDDRDRKLRIFAGSEHPFSDRPLESFVMPPRKVREMRPRVRRAMIRAQKKVEESDASKLGMKKE